MNLKEAEPLIGLTYQRYDLTFKTDESCKPVLLFIGKRDQQGQIKGERFARQTKRNWDNKGRISYQVNNSCASV